MVKPEGDWELESFRRVHLDASVETLVDSVTDKALVVWPWWADHDDIQRAVEKAGWMGYENLTEHGNLQGYRIPEVDCDDYDYVVLEAIL